MHRIHLVCTFTIWVFLNHVRPVFGDQIKTVPFNISATYLEIRVSCDWEAVVLCNDFSLKDFFSYLKFKLHREGGTDSSVCWFSPTMTATAGGNGARRFFRISWVGGRGPYLWGSLSCFPRPSLDMEQLGLKPRTGASMGWWCYCCSGFCPSWYC